MKVNIKSVFICSMLFVFVSLFISGCKDTTQSTQSTPLVTILSIADQSGVPGTIFKQGEPISFTTRLINASRSTQEVAISGCSPLVNIFNHNTLIYSASNMCLAMIPPKTTIVPGQTITAYILWNQEDTHDQQVPVGDYSAVGATMGFWITGTDGTDTFSQSFPASRRVYFSIGQ